MTVKSTIKDLVETLEDGREGFKQGAEKLAKDGQTRLADTFRELSQQRATFSAELRRIAKTHGEDVDESGSMMASLHRGWMSLKDAVAGDDPEGVLDAAEQGEDHAKKEYADALKDNDLPVDLREVVERQSREVNVAHDKVKALRDAHSS